MGFTSGKISHDPMPNKRFNTYDRVWTRYPELAFGRFIGDEYAPRPEFDNHNPILVAFRESVERDGMKDTLHFFDEEAGPATDTPEHIAHARRVLEKLAALA